MNRINITGNLPWSRIDNIPQFFPPKISLLIADQNLDIGNHKFMNNGVHLVGLSNNSVVTNSRADVSERKPKIL